VIVAIAITAAAEPTTGPCRALAGFAHVDGPPLDLAPV
jgi:hypothetical protein